MGNMCRCLRGGSSYPVRKVVKWKQLVYLEVQYSHYVLGGRHCLENIVKQYLRIYVVRFKPCLHLGRCVYLAATLSSGLVAVRVKAFADITVAGATHGASPPAFRTRFLHPDGEEMCINVNIPIHDFYLDSQNSKSD